MYVDAELILLSYKPLKLEKGMLFLNRETDPPEIYELNHSVIDSEAYMINNGCPVELQLMEVSLKNVIALHHEIGWIDEGEDSEDMHEITIDDINSILANKHICQIQIKDKLYEKENMIIPVYDEEKVIIKLIEKQED